MILPPKPAVCAVERKYPAVGSGEIEHATGNDRRGLKAVLIIAGLKNPDRRKFLDVAAVHLRQRAVSPGAIGTAIMRPVIFGGARLGTKRRGSGEKEKRLFHRLML